MALVAYDSSEYSESEEEDEPSSSATKSNLGLSSQTETHLKQERNVELLPNKDVADLPIVLNNSLFASLPSPRSSVKDALPEEEDDDFLNVGTRPVLVGEMKSKESKPVQITIPALSQLDDIDEPTAKKPHLQSGKGLFSVLPPPKHGVVKVANRALIPHSVGKKKTEERKRPSKPAVLGVLPSASNLKRTPFGTNDDSDEDDDDNHDSSVDFFSLDSMGKQTDLMVGMKSEAFDGPATPEQEFPSISSECCDVPLKFRDDWPAVGSLTPVKLLLHHSTVQEEPSTSGSIVLSQSSVNAPPLNDGSLTSLFADEGFMRLHGKKRGKEEDIEIIDVSQDDQLPKTEEWLTKILTQESEYRPSRKKGFMPTAQQRRKHQITYLAFQAKERELELKNQWSQNRFTKRQTQSKYGF